jgi:hypothetical protein
MVYFQIKNPNFGNFFFWGGGGLGMENVGMIYEHMEYLKAIWYI